MLSIEPVNVKWYLIEAPCSLLNQSKRGQDDGWGIAYWKGGGLKLVKKAAAAYEDEEFVRRAKGIETCALIAHVRKASNPLNLPKEAVVNYEATQPFTYLSYAFAHNGTIYIPIELRKELGKYEQLIRSNNDSEVLFWLLMKELDQTQEVEEALKRALDIIWSVWEREGREKEMPYSALNFLLLKKGELYAYCNYLKDKERSLCYGRHPYYEMRFKADGEHVVVASEAMDEEKWNPIENGHLLKCWSEKEEIAWELSKLKLFTPKLQ